MVKKIIAIIVLSVLTVSFAIGMFTMFVHLVDVPSAYSGVLIVNTDDSQGSCFVVTQRDGWWYAITAGHIVESSGLDPIDLTVDDELYEVEIVRESSNEDLALIRFKSPEEYRVYSFSRAKVGEFCTTVGFNGGRMIYKGYVVSTSFREYVVANGGVIPGCSGGALLNIQNEVIGVTVAIPVYGFGALDSSALYVPARFAEAMVITIGD